MPNFAFLALEPSDGTVVVTAMVLVFAMLIVLCVIIMLVGKFFDRNKAQAAAPKPAAAPVAAAPSAARPAPAAAAAAPAAGGALPGEIVAAISAAVYATMGEDAVIHSIRRAARPAGSRRGAWGNAAVHEQTAPFV